MSYFNKSGVRKFLTIVFLAVSILATSISVHAKGDGSEIQKSNLFPKVKFETDMGDIVVELDRRRAPITVNNFLRYVEKGSYDDTIFHRIIPNFAVQGGGYDKDYVAKPSFGTIINESGNGLKNDMYTIAMARQDDPHSANRQFFFNVIDNAFLNPGRDWGYAVFGLVVQGAEVVDAMAQVETAYNMDVGWKDVPVKPLMLKKVTLLPMMPVQPRANK